MTGLVLHPATATALELATRRPGHALLLVGAVGSGKFSIARSMTAAALALDEAKLNDYPYKLFISGSDKAVGIDAIRELDRFLSLRVPSSNEYNRGVIIENIHGLSTEAQTALLKTLEEPPAGTLLILTADNEQHVLPTIRSRAPAILVKAPARQRLEAFFGTQFDKAAVAQAYAISGGLPGLMQALLAESDHPLLMATETARQILAQPTYERLLLADQLSKQRQLAQDTVFILQQMAHVSLQTATGAKADRWRKILQASYRAGESLSANAQPKLVLTQLMLSF